MMTAKLKLQCPGGQATPAPPWGRPRSARSEYRSVRDQVNERTKDIERDDDPVEITIYSDHSFKFITKSPPPRCC